MRIKVDNVIVCWIASCVGSFASNFVTMASRAFAGAAAASLPAVVSAIIRCFGEALCDVARRLGRGGVERSTSKRRQRLVVIAAAHCPTAISSVVPPCHSYIPQAAVAVLPFTLPSSLPRSAANLGQRLSIAASGQPGLRHHPGMLMTWHDMT